MDEFFFLQFLLVSTHLIKNYALHFNLKILLTIACGFIRLNDKDQPTVFGARKNTDTNTIQ